MYWIRGGDTSLGLGQGKVIRTPRVPSDSTVLIAGQESPVGIAIDASSVYWATQGNPEQGMPGVVLKMPK